WAASASQPFSRKEQPTMKSIAVALLLAASRLTGLEAPTGAEPPRIERMEPCTMEREVHRLNNWPAPRACAVGSLMVDAFYHRGRVVLRASWDAGSLRDRAVLLHELVHWLQDTQPGGFGRYRCAAEAERVAYDAMFAYM